MRRLARGPAITLLLHASTVLHVSSASTLGVKENVRDVREVATEPVAETSSIVREHFEADAKPSLIQVANTMKAESMTVGTMLSSSDAGIAAAAKAEQLVDVSPVTNYMLSGEKADFTMSNVVSYIRSAFLLTAVGLFYMFGLRWDMRGVANSKVPGESLDIDLLNENRARMKAEWEAARTKEFPSTTASHGGKPPQGVAADGIMLPTIWPKLTKLQSTTHLRVPTVKCEGQDWSALVLSGTSSPVLQLAVNESPQGGRLLELSAAGLGGLRLATVGATAFDLKSFRTNIGRFEARPSGPMVLVDASGRELLLVEQDVETARIEVLTVAERHLLGSLARRNACQRTTHDHFEIIVEPAVDVVLVLSCALSRLVFGTPPKSVNSSE